MKKNKKYFIISILLAVVAVIIIQQNTGSTLEKEGRDFAIKDTSLISKIYLANKTPEEITLTREGNSLWMVNNKYPVNHKKMQSFLKTLSLITVKTPVATTARNNVLKDMATIATKVEIYQDAYHINLFGKLKLFPYEKRTKTYYVGTNTMNNMGTNMLIEDADDPYITHIPGFRGFLSTRFTTLEKDWRDHSIFNYSFNQISTVRLDFPQQPEQSYEISKNNNSISLVSIANGETISNIDTNRILRYFSSFKLIKFEILLDNLEATKRDSLLASTPLHIMSVTNSSGEKTSIKTWKRKNIGDLLNIDGTEMEWDPDRLYALINKGKDLTIIQYYVFDKILPPLDYFRLAE